MVHMLQVNLTGTSNGHLAGQQAHLSGDECYQCRQLDAPLRHGQCDAHALHAGAVPQPLYSPKEVLRAPQQGVVRSQGANPLWFHACRSLAKGRAAGGCHALQRRTMTMSSFAQKGQSHSVVRSRLFLYSMYIGLCQKPGLETLLLTTVPRRATLARM